MEKILKLIQNNSYTISQIRRRIRVLKNYLTNQYFSQAFDLSQISSHNSDIAWIKSLDQNILSSINSSNLNEVFDQLETEVKRINVLTVYLPVDFDEDQQNQIGLYVQNNFSQKPLIDIKLDPTLIAGCALVWNGIYKDYSLRKRIQDNKEKLLSQMKQFLR